MPVRSFREEKIKMLKEPGRAESYLKLSFEEVMKDGCYEAFYIGLRDVIEAKGITKADLAKNVGIGRQHLHFILTGKGNPSFSSVMEIVKALGLSCALVDDENIAA